MTDTEHLIGLYRLFATLTARDGLDAYKVHQAFLAVPEYRRSIPLDMLPREYRDRKDD